MRSLSVDLGVDVPMADGTILAADVVRPSAAASLPTVLLRTPYNRQTAASRSLQIDALGLAAHGYAVVLQDTRGRFASAGDHIPFVDERDDGVDTLEWIADRPWSNGRVAMAGSSYLGFCQLAAASAQPEPLAAIMPALTCCDVRDGWLRESGAFNAGLNLSWVLGALLAEDPRVLDQGPIRDACSRPRITLGPDSMIDELILASPLADTWSAWLAGDAYDEVASVPTRDSLGGVTIPALVVAGWFDVFQPSTFELHDVLGPGDSLMVGPWAHTRLPLGRREGEVDHGAAAAPDLAAVQRAFLDQYLRGSEPAGDYERIFVTGANRWEHFSSWPPPGRRVALFPEPESGMATSPAHSSVDVILDPADPTPAVGGRLYPWEPDLVPGPFDQTSRDTRSDVITYTTDPLESPWFVAGPVTVTVSIDGDAEEASGRGAVVAVVSDVDPAGPVRNVADGVAASGPRPVEVALGHTAHVFEAGHRIRLSLSFGAFPRLRWQPGSGRRTISLDSDTRLELWTI